MSTIIDRQVSFDFEFALSNLGGDQDLLQTLASMFAEDVPAEIRGIEQSLAAGQWQDLQLHAHTLKGLCATFAAEPLRSIAHELELGAKHGESELKLSRLVSEVKAVEQATVSDLNIQSEAFLRAKSALPSD